MVLRHTKREIERSREGSGIRARECERAREIGESKTSVSEIHKHEHTDNQTDTLLIQWLYMKHGVWTTYSVGRYQGECEDI